MADYMERIAHLLLASDSRDAVLPPTTLYCEGWMLRLVLDWFSRRESDDHPLSLARDARWASEALLPTQFRGNAGGPRLAEGFTHADGVVGHFQFRGSRRAIELMPHARQFVVVEAKMFSALSAGTRYSPTFDQAARNVACMAEVIHQCGREPASFERLGFLVVAPEKQVTAGVFSALTRADHKNSLAATVLRRVEEYAEGKRSWHESAFLPLLDRLDVQVLTWESVVDHIAARDPEAGSSLAEFLDRSLHFNQPVSPARPARTPTRPVASRGLIDDTP